jgi:hypothetical protein
LLAWQLARSAPGEQVDLVLGNRCRADATAASGGAVRGYETDPRQRALALASLAELLASPTLRRWSGFRPAESFYLPERPGQRLAAELAEIEAAVPGSASLVPAAELARRGWARLPAGAVAVRERRAGYLVPGRLRDAVLADGAGRRRVRLLPAALAAVRLRPGAGVRCRVAGRERDYDRLVIAAGAWTGAVLAMAGLPASGFRTKSIQYTVYRVDGWRPPMFVDEPLGCYGRPQARDQLLLGVPTDQWEVDPDRPPTTPELPDLAVHRARTRFPGLRIGPATRTVGSVDCYTDQPTLSLSAVPGTGDRAFTFTGGAGGCVKTALAASRDAAVRLIEPGDRSALVPLGPREGQP